MCFKRMIEMLQSQYKNISKIFIRILHFFQGVYFQGCIFSNFLLWFYLYNFFIDFLKKKKYRQAFALRCKGRINLILFKVSLMNNRKLAPLSFRFEIIIVKEEFPVTLRVTISLRNFCLSVLRC